MLSKNNFTIKTYYNKSIKWSLFFFLSHSLMLFFKNIKKAHVVVECLILLLTFFVLRNKNELP